MDEVFWWSGIGGRWDDPGIWRLGEIGGANQPVNSRAADRAPGSGDTVFFANTYASGVTVDQLGPITGGGTAAKVTTAVDFGAIPLFDDGVGPVDVYRFDDLDLNGRILVTNGSFLYADEADLDPSAILNISQGGTTMDSAGRVHSAWINSLVVAAPTPAEFGGQITLGGNNLVVGNYVTGNPDGVTGSGFILPASGSVGEVPPPAPTTPVNWDAIAARVMGFHAITGIWADPGPTWEPGLPIPGPDPDATPVNWDELAARVTANFETTGQWFA